jgi:hypothetical protein
LQSINLAGESFRRTGSEANHHMADKKKGRRMSGGLVVDAPRVKKKETLGDLRYLTGLGKSESPLGVIRRPTITMSDLVPTIVIQIIIGCAGRNNDKTSPAPVIEDDKSGASIECADADLLAIAACFL